MRLDGPRCADDPPPWTVALRHPDLGETGALRAGTRHFHEVIGFIRGRAGTLPGDLPDLRKPPSPGTTSRTNCLELESKRWSR
ncbi:hypothetical protein [Lentzea aerocolonigenes]|uniref:hypothetical protein n=1 Tax=Lentzea aerocolonigenes TaxID=68170 RepID=UPI0004C3877E|nr:hypothetical protein [Lentzea aerocolonigenes]